MIHIVGQLAFLKTSAWKLLGQYASSPADSA